MNKTLQTIKSRNFIPDQIMIILLAFNYGYAKTWYSLGLVIIFAGMVIYRQTGFNTK